MLPNDPRDAQDESGRGGGGRGDEGALGDSCMPNKGDYVDCFPKGMLCTPCDN